MKRYILFDLDGALADSMVGVTKAIQQGLHSQGIEVADYRDLRALVGPPSQEAYVHQYGMTAAQAKEAHRVQAAYYAQTGLFENEPYPGMETLLKNLRQAGRRLAVATSKPRVFAERIMEYFSWTDYFEVVMGSELDGRRQKKAEVIEEVLHRLGNPPTEQVVMIGDREYDVIGAHKLAMDCIGVLYGYGSREELERAGAELIVQNIAALERFLLGDDDQRRTDY